MKSRAGKATGVHKNWYNISSPESNDVMAVDLSKLTILEVNGTSNVHTNESDIDQDGQVFICNDEAFGEAKMRELKTWRDFNVFEEVENTGQSYITTRWVMSIKADGTKKARLVARGFEDDCLSKSEKESPTCPKEAFRIAVSICGSKKWIIHSLDVKTAFLQGIATKRNVFLLPPPEEATSKPGKLWRVNKCVYGLGDASVQWYLKVKQVLKLVAATVSKWDPALFYVHEEDILIGLIVVHVDDFLWSGNEKFSKQFLDVIRGEVVVGKESESSFRYLGLQLNQKCNFIEFDQTQYVNNLEFLKDRDRIS